MGEKYRVDPKVKIIWMLPYIGVFLLIWGVLSVLIIFAQDQFPFFLKDFSPFLASLILFIIIGILVLVPSYIWVTLRYNNLYYEITDNNFIISQGVISKKQTVIPYDTLEDVGVKRSLIEQIIGLSTLELDTAGSSEIEGILPGISDPEYVVKIIKEKMTVHQTGEENANDIMKKILKELREIKKILAQENSSPPSTRKSIDVLEEKPGSKLEKLIKKKFRKED